MKRNLLLLTASFIFFVFLTVNVHAQTQPSFVSDPEDLPINIKAVTLKYDQEGEYLNARGNVEIQQGSRTLHADYVKINLVTKDTEAKGNVKLVEGGDVIHCEAFNINLDTQLGEIFSAKIFIKEQNLHVRGEKIEKTGLNVYKIEQGIITTCDAENPAWKIDAENIDLTIEGYAVSRKTTLKIKGIPLLYLPIAMFPVKTKRQSGFLFPEFGHTRNLGWGMGNSFFWAISENTDATFWLDTTTRRGIGGGIEYRFKLSEQTEGRIYGYLTEEKKRFFKHVYRDPRDRDRGRGYINFEGEHYFDDSSYVKVSASNVTDREFYHDYKRMVKRSKGEVNKSTIKSSKKDESLIFYNKNWDFQNLLVNANVYKNLTRSDPRTLQRLPRVVFSTMRRPVSATPLYYQFDSSYDYFWREKGQKGHRVDVFPKMSFPVNYNGWLKFNPEIGVRGLSYFDIEHENDYDESGVFPSVTSELNTTFFRIFQVNGKKVQKLKHTVEPGLRYEFQPSNDQRDFPRFDIPEQFYKRHSISYYVKNRYTGLLLDDGGELIERELGYFLIGQSYHISKPGGGIYIEGDRDEHFSDIFTELRIDFFPSVYFKLKAYYDTYGNSIRAYNALINWNNEKEDFLELEYRYVRHMYEILDLEGRLQLLRWLYVFFDTRYDYLDNEDFDSEIGVDISSQCWGIRFSVESSGSSGGMVDDISFNYLLYLKGLGGLL